MSHTSSLRRVFNEYNEELEVFPDLVLNLEYWDCICEGDYIHPVSLPWCHHCGETRDERPNAREPEVRALRERTNA